MAYPIIDIANIRETLDERERKKMARYHRREARVQRKKRVIDALYNI